jgi:hypothetical protein
LLAAYLSAITAQILPISPCEGIGGLSLLTRETMIA